jgi:hypothetical protein
MVTVLLVLNTLAALVSALSSLLAVARPGLMTRSSAPTVGERFYVLAYAARAVPFGVAAAVLPLTGRGFPVALVLFAAATAQLADAGIGMWRKERGMIAGGATLSVVHLITAIAVL